MAINEEPNGQAPQAPSDRTSETRGRRDFVKQAVILGAAAAAAAGLEQVQRTRKPGQLYNAHKEKQ